MKPLFPLFLVRHPLLPPPPLHPLLISFLSLNSVSSPAPSARLPPRKTEEEREDKRRGGGGGRKDFLPREPESESASQKDRERERERAIERAREKVVENGGADLLACLLLALLRSKNTFTLKDWDSKLDSRSCCPPPAPPHPSWPPELFLLSAPARQVFFAAAFAISPGVFAVMLSACRPAANSFSNSPYTILGSRVEGGERGRGGANVTRAWQFSVRATP
jgi:hypothetical protein